MYFKYEKENLKKISFPLGGIGSGTVGLSGIGRLIDWEIFNRPNKESYNEYTHFAIKAEVEGKVLDTRVLQGDIQDNFIGEGDGSHHSWGIGHGPNRTTLAGLPHFKEVTFTGEFPIAKIEFKDEAFPGNITLKAFNPFIPSNEKDSSIPVAFFEWTVHNPTDKAIDYTLNFACGNVFKPKSVNKYETCENLHMIKMYSEENDVNDVRYGNITVATDSEDISYQEYWYRSGWFDNVTVYWKEFNTFGKFNNRFYKEPGNDSVNGEMCVLAPKINVKPYESKKVRFILSWFVPNCYKYWDENEFSKNKIWKNYYATIFKSSDDIAEYCLKNWDRLEQDTEIFHESLFSSTLPGEVIDAIQGNIAILKSSTCLRLENGEFYGWEGTNKNTGSCEGSCTHVWNYAYALPFLFPSLERSMRELDYRYNLRENGGMTFRLSLPLGSEKSGFRPCVDGQMGGIIKFYRDWKICGDDDWLRNLWPSVKKSLEYAWNSENYDKWDPEKNGVITGRQHHTLDVELFGPNSWLSGFYLTALKAASEIALYLGEEEEARGYRIIFEKGSKWIEENLFNGEYYVQKIDLKDKKVLEEFRGNDANIENYYWNYEAEEIKYQIQDGCAIDQMVAQWHAGIIGLEDIFNKKNRRKALESIYKLNFMSMRDNFNPCRIFSVNDEKGVIICNWPKDKYKPLIPIPYTEETMCGFEYAVADLMIREGMVNEGLEIIRAIRERYDGRKRNPWSEIECGTSYARSMASYSTLLTLSGFTFDMSKKYIGFNPVGMNNTFKCFWSIEGVWGTFEINKNSIRFNVLYGRIELSSFGMPMNFNKVKYILIDNKNVEFELKDRNVEFNNSINLEKNSVLYIIK